jgi:hypothetical protein
LCDTARHGVYGRRVVIRRAYIVLPHAVVTLVWLGNLPAPVRITVGRTALRLACRV